MSATPAARIAQGASNDLDDTLTLQARSRRPGVQHWWGRRTWTRRAVNVYDFGPAGEWEGMPQLQRQTGAWCYLCDKPIATWSRRWPMTEGARALVNLHRTAHIQLELDASPTRTVEERQ